MSRLLFALFCFVSLFSAQPAGAETLRQRIDRIQAAILAHKDQIANQEMVVHFSDGLMDLRTESRVVGDEGSVIIAAQMPRPGTTSRQFEYLPALLVHPLRPLPPAFISPVSLGRKVSRIPVATMPSASAAFRLLPAETINGTVYDVVEVTQNPLNKDMMHCGDAGLVLTKIVCKLYIDKDGLVQRKSGVFLYRDPATKAVAGKKSREQRATFESNVMTYRNPPEASPKPIEPTTP